MQLDEAGQQRLRDDLAIELDVDSDRAPRMLQARRRATAPPGCCWVRPSRRRRREGCPEADSMSATESPEIRTPCRFPGVRLLNPSARPLVAGQLLPTSAEAGSSFEIHPNQRQFPPRRRRTPRRPVRLECGVAPALPSVGEASATVWSRRAAAGRRRSAEHLAVEVVGDAIGGLAQARPNPLSIR